MTFKVNPEKWNSVPGYRLKAELDEFERWFTENAAFMKPEDAARGHRLLEQMKEAVSRRNDVDPDRYYVDIHASSPLGSQLRFFPAYK